VSDIIDTLAGRNNPVIILGDLNSELSKGDSALKELVDRCRLHTYKPLANGLGTLLDSERRLDWILISSELKFNNYRVLQDVVSDHYAVVAEVALKDAQDIKQDGSCDSMAGDNLM
jgi:endonuclease/exonuclease/phosphatase family metal-dependent hydrolase